MSKRAEVERLHKAQMTPRQIAAALGLSTQGVHYHLKRIKADEAKRLASRDSA